MHLIDADLITQVDIKPASFRHKAFNRQPKYSNSQRTRAGGWYKAAVRDAEQLKPIIHDIELMRNKGYCIVMHTTPPCTAVSCAATTVLVRDIVTGVQLVVIAQVRLQPLATAAAILMF
jgi:hypothetical protein